ncbi:Glycerol-3-phosphate dehydrogenase NAD(+) [Porphyridium purpureum]|uniref:Glycerol-3-phosphate dehydrogenase [NAD(+)] n=1 Tax=Porphyridium purpureum TaxID=35688 RepID=A0A5J4YMH7_PORPP|nr:Glycerol-3-phosphate dehydrogenase NAD(+) [Porphyridium purpureum]KAA8492355.1 Glycerol-3-phosphate dehydrogenase NAD(+) [Porphyridium purpureum]|eukprot:POR1412..scf249_10
MEGMVRRDASPEVLQLWRNAECVAFDIDCTITINDSLDALGEFLGVGEQIQKITNAAMDGHLDLETALQQRLDAMNLTTQKIQAFVNSHPVEKRLVPNIRTLIEELQARNVEVFLISGGFRELILPVAKALGVPKSNIFANRFVYMADDNAEEDQVSSQSLRVTTFDPKEPTSRGGGKPEAIRRIREKRPYNTIVMVGDGITDLEAGQETGGADLFIGYGGVVQREAVMKEADWFVDDHAVLAEALPRLKVAMIGSGAWACASMRMVAENARSRRIFYPKVKMWVFEEEHNGEKLTELINRTHENPKYLPGCHFGDNVEACSDIVSVVQDADILIFCTPHQFVHRLCLQIKSHVKPGCFAISLIKGMRVRTDGPQLISTMIQRTLMVDCSVLMGANIANQIGPGSLCEATIASKNVEHARLLKLLFHTEYFYIDIISDVEGAEMSGTLKNVVALAAGFADGSGYLDNCKAVILREGLKEMRELSIRLYPSVRESTFFEACGVADLIATCSGGRNHKVAMEFAKRGGSDSFDTLEAELLHGQKLQGTLTSHEVQSCLKIKGWEADFPLLKVVDLIVNGVYEPADIARFRDLNLFPIVKSPTAEALAASEDAAMLDSIQRRVSILEVRGLV